MLEYGIPGGKMSVSHRAVTGARVPDPNDERDLAQRLAVYLGQLAGRPVAVSGLRRFPAGFSWITWGFSTDAPGIDGMTRLILRLGPANGLFAPYSAQPQYAALKALEGSAVPAPRALCWSDDPTILGAPFFVSEFVGGSAPIPWGADGDMDDARRQLLGEQFTDALAALHMLDWRGHGLAPDGAEVTMENAARQQIDAWAANYERWSLKPYPMVHHTLRWLRDNQPVAPRVSIIHGDYRLGNFLEEHGQISSILDWELVHLGDPHEDIGWLSLPQYRGGTRLLSRLIAPEAFAERYQMRTGITLVPASMKVYEIFSLLKLAVTHMAGVSAFERQGFCDMRMPAMGTQIFPVLRQIEKTLEAGR
jgi:aminoglycoside phosphotransferase (APT) family kinase protein